MAILTSGGDAPGMNAAIRAAALVGLGQGRRVLGVEHGYQGLIDGRLRELGADDVAGIIREGGTILGSARCMAFMEPAGRDAARRRLAEAGVLDLLVVGGNGSLAGAEALTSPDELGDQTLRVFGVPASIDNDIGLTALSIGVDTAMNTIVEACDKISDTATAHERTFIVEVMGRQCGYLAMTAAVAAAADVVLFRESGRSEEEIVAGVTAAIRAARQRSRKRVLVIKSEGVSISSDRLKDRVDAQLRADAGGGSIIETRVAVLGHIVRGGRPSAFDRLMASRLARVAVVGLAEGCTRMMAAWSVADSLPAELGSRSQADPHCWRVGLEAVLSETKRLLDGTSPLVQWRARAFDEIEDIMRL